MVLSIARSLSPVRRGAGRKRRIAGWTLLALGVLVAGVWVASGWRSMVWSRYGTRWTIEKGGITLEPNGLYQRQWFRSGPTGAAWDVNWLATGPSDSGGTSFLLGWHWTLGGGPYRMVTVYFWPLPLVMLIAGGDLLRSGVVARRRASGGACRTCGYSLAGLAAGAVCPECGGPGTGG